MPNDLPLPRGYAADAATAPIQGGTGVVVRCTRGGASFAVKRIGTAPRDADPARQREALDAFAREREALGERVRAGLSEGCNVAVPTFLREGDQFYTAAPYLTDARVPHERVLFLPREVKYVLLGTALNAVARLHAAGIVHGDVSPRHLMRVALPNGRLVSRLIDLDGAWLAERGGPSQTAAVPRLRALPPAREMPCLSPEMAMWRDRWGDVPDGTLSPAMDVFALGCVFHLWLTGAYPAAPRGTTAGLALACGQGLWVGTRLTKGMACLISGMLAPLADRVDAAEAARLLRQLGPDATRASTYEREAAQPLSARLTDAFLASARGDAPCVYPLQMQDAVALKDAKSACDEVTRALGHARWRTDVVGARVDGAPPEG